jgi:hypothetical protein
MSSYTFVIDRPELPELELMTHTTVLVATVRVDQRRVRAAADAVFSAHPCLGAVFEPFFGTWLSRPGGGWGWAVEPPATAVGDVVERHRGSFDMRTGRLFAVSLLPGSPDRLVLSASRLCLDPAAWDGVVGELTRAYGGDALAREGDAPTSR